MLICPEAHLREPLLGRDNAQSQGPGLTLQRDSEVDSKDSAHVTDQQSQEKIGMTTSSAAVRVNEEECNCLPWRGRRYSLGKLFAILGLGFDISLALIIEFINCCVCCICWPVQRHSFESLFLEERLRQNFYSRVFYKGTLKWIQNLTPLRM
jgi:hypothetical protein